MKFRNLFFILAAAAMFTVVSCKDEKEPEPTPTPEASLTVAPTSVSVTAAGETKSLTVKATGDWTVKSSESWAKVSPEKGSKDGSVSVSVDANVGAAGSAAAAREATLSFAMGEKKVDVKVSQAAEAIVFTVSGGTVELPAAGGKVNVSVEYNESYTTETLPAWITPATKATATDALVYDVAANEAFEAREGEIAFKSASGKTGKVTVKQAAAEKPAGKSLKTAQDLKDFAAAVNSRDAAAIAAYDPDGDGVFKLEADIDFGGETIVPIGNGSYSNATSYSGASFKKATFDGQNHVVDNYVISEAEVANCAIGFFGILDSAVVKNVVAGPKVKVSTAVAGASHAGALIGFAWDSDIENCTNKGSVSATVGFNDKRTIIGGVMGGIIAKGKDCTITNCVNEGTLTSTNTVNTKNGASGFHVGGVIGMTDGAVNDQTFICKVINCVNKADITAQATRMAGVVATPNKHSTLSGCVNEGNIVDTDVTASNSRPSGICSTTGVNCLIEKCINKGDVTFGVEGDTTHGFTAGICAQPNSAGKIIECENYGTIRSDIIKATDANKKYIGAIFCHTNKAAGEIKNCKVEGSVGPFVEDDTYKVVKLNKENFMSYITMIPLDDAQNASAIVEGNYCTVEAGAEPKILDIKTGEEFVAFVANRTVCSDPEYVINLANDIDLSGLTVAKADTLNAVLDGQKHSIKNWNATTPLFTLNCGTIKDITIDASCVLVPSDGNSAFFCEKNQPGANIIGCVNNASYNSNIVRAAQPNFGFFAAINYGYFKDCVNNGNIDIELPDGSSAVKFFVGGLAGYFNNSTNLQNGVQNGVAFDNCKNNGNITIHSAIKPGNSEIGGITGGTSGAKVSASTDRGSILNCENTGNISYSFDMVDSGTYTNLGGVTGYLEGSIKGCKNSGTVTYKNNLNSEKNSTRASVGGVVACVRFNAEDLVNNGKVVAEGCYGAGTKDAAYAGPMENPTFGGVIGQAGPSRENITEDSVISGCVNNGEISINSKMVSTNSTVVYFGGVIGYSTAKVTGCSNTAAINVTAGQKSCYMGGVVGCALMSVEDSWNSGKINFGMANTAANSAWGMYVGGVIGDCNVAIASARNLENKADGDITIAGEFNATTTYYQYAGGVIGRCNKQIGEISGFKNSADITISTPSYFRVGGLIGSADTKKMSDCSSSGVITYNAKQFNTSFPGVGGLAGHSAALDVDNCSTTTEMKVTAECECNIGLLMGSVGNTAQTWDGCTIGSKISVSSDKTQRLGYVLGGLIDVNDAEKTIVVGAEKPLVLAAAATINGVAATEADVKDPAKLCGYFMPDDAFKAKFVLADGGVVLEGGSTPSTDPDIPGVGYKDPGVTL